MPVLTRPQLQAKAVLIRDESASLANTALRIGGTLLDMIDSLALLTEIASGLGGWTDDGAVVRLTTAADNVVLGAAAMVGAEKLRVVGATRLEGDVALPASNLLLGATPSASGRVRLTAGDSISWDAPNGAGDNVGLAVENLSGANVASVGGTALDANRVGVAQLNAITSAHMRVGGAARLSVSSTLIACALAVSIGALTSASGILRIPFDQMVTARGGFGAFPDIHLLGLVDVATDNAIAIGGVGSGTHVPARTRFNASGGHAFQISGVEKFSVGTANTQISNATLRFAAAVVSPTITQEAEAGATGDDLLIQAQNAATTGGGLDLRSGTGGTAAGDVFLRRGSTLHVQVTSQEVHIPSTRIAFGSGSFSTDLNARIAVPHSATNAILSGRTNGSANAHLLRWGFANDTLQIGDSTASTVAAINLDTVTAGTVAIRPGGNARLTVVDGSVSVGSVLLQFANAVANPVFRQDHVGDASTNNLTIRAQGRTLGTGNGGHLNLEGGRHSGSTNRSGGVRLRLNPAFDASLINMLEVAELNDGNRVVALCRGATTDASNSQVPTGDLVVYIANAGTVPSSNPAGGGILYAEAGALKWRGSGGTVTTLGAA